MPEPFPLPDALQKFRQLTPQIREQVVSSFEKQTAFLSLDDLADAVAHESHVDRGLVRDLAGGVSALIPVALDQPELGRSLASFFVQHAFEDSAKGPEVQQLQSDLERLLRCEQSIGLTGKAQSIIWGHGSTFQNAHVITQVRPLFLANLSADSSTAVIVHELRLDYKEGENARSMCFALDEARIVQLQKVLDRALQKERSLRNRPRFNYLSARKG